MSSEIRLPEELGVATSEAKDPPGNSLPASSRTGRYGDRSWLERGSRPLAPKWPWA